MPKEELEKIVKESKTFSEILSHFGLKNKGRNNYTLKKRLNEDGIDYSNIIEWLNNNRSYFIPKNKVIHLSDILVVGSSYNRTSLKKRLIKNGMLKEQCSECGLKNVWRNKKLSLVLDHINGVSNDNRIENLRLLCPNCHSQTDTFAGRNKRIVKIVKKCRCGKEINKYSTLCFECSCKKNGLRRRKVENRPTKEELLDLLKENSYCAVGRMFGVSDNAIRKWL